MENTVNTMTITLDEYKKMIDILENDDDVQKVYHNCAVSLDD